MKIRHGYDKSVRQPHPKCGQTLTEKHHEKACNINSIMAKYQKTGLISHVNARQGRFVDVSSADFLTAQNLIAEAKTEFEELPAQARYALNNDVAEYLELISQDDGEEQLRAILDPQEEEIVQENASEELSDAPKTVTDETETVT